jgi:hypothetical protein
MMSLNGKILNESDTINVNSNQNLTYYIACSSINSKPQVNITLYDTNTNRSLQNINNFVSSSSCDSLKLCTSINQYKFQEMDLMNLTSITCRASSVNSIPLTASIQRNVINSQSKCIYTICLNILI